MSSGSFWQRLVHGSRWLWLSERHRAVLPADLAATVMQIRSSDRFHAKQGRSTARVRFESAGGSLSVYLKRHYHLPLASRLAALIDPGGHHTPATAELRHLDQARQVGLAVPEAVAAGEWVGPWGALRSFLMVAELSGSQALNEVLPDLARALAPRAFARLKRELIAEMARMTAALHRAGLFHKDLYLCHFFVNLDPGVPAGRRLTLIDLHRLGRHHWAALRFRCKDLAQLLYSTFEVGAIDDRDRLRFWKHYRKQLELRQPAWQMRWIVRKARIYGRHNAANHGPIAETR